MQLGHCCFYYCHSIRFQSGFFSSLFKRSSSTSIHCAAVGSASRRWQKGQKTSRFSTLWLFQFTADEMWDLFLWVRWDLPSLTSFKAEYLNFYAIGHVVLEGWIVSSVSLTAIPYPPPSGYSFGEHVFEYVTTLDATCIVSFHFTCSFSRSHDISAAELYVSPIKEWPVRWVKGESLRKVNKTV